MRKNETTDGKTALCDEGHTSLLLVDPETETEPTRDVDGNLQYYCVICNATFSVADDRFPVI